MDMRSPARRRRKKPTNLSLDPALLAEAKRLGISLSSFVEEKLADEVRRRRWDAWRAGNRAAIEAYNRHIERDGIFGEEYRRY